MREAYGTAEFFAEYQAALDSLLNGTAAPVKGAPASGTVGWLLACYRDSGAWTGLSLATRRQRENIFKNVLPVIGTLPYDGL